MDRVILNKLTSVDRCLTRIDEVYTNFETLQSNYTQQDAIILNIERACQACIDAALHFVKVKKLGLPQSSKEAFLLLQQNGIIDTELSKSMQNMVGFRNIAIHEYQSLNLEILDSIINTDIVELRTFISVLLKSD